MARIKRDIYEKERAENIKVCLTCKRARCSGLKGCMLERKREMLKQRKEAE